MQYKLESLEGYDAIYPVNIAKLIAVINSENVDASPQGRYGTVSNKYSDLLSLTNTKYLLNIENPENDKKPPEGSHVTEVFRDRSVVVYKNDRVLPRAYVVYDWEYLDKDEDVLNKMLSDNFDQKNHIILSGNDKQVVSGKESVRVNYMKYSDMEQIIEFKSSEDGYLFVSDSFYPGWKAFVNDHPVNIERANYAFRAVRVHKGTNIVRFVYRPDSFYNGLLISIGTVITLLFTAILVFVKEHSLSYTNHSPDE